MNSKADMFALINSYDSSSVAQKKNEILREIECALRRTLKTRKAIICQSGYIIDAEGRRKEDIPLLVEQFIVRFNRLQQKTIRGIAPEAISLLMANDWPGNIRELENAIERAFILCNEGVIAIEHLPEELSARYMTRICHADMQTSRELMKAEVIRNALEQADFNRLAAACSLGIYKNTLFRKMKRLGISLPSRDGGTRIPT